MHYNYFPSPSLKRLDRRRSRYVARLEVRRVVATEVLHCGVCGMRSDALNEDDRCLICEYDWLHDLYEEDYEYDRLREEDYEYDRLREKQYERMETDRWNYCD